MSEVIVMTPDQLKSTLEGVVLGALEKFQHQTNETNRREETPDTINLPAAVRLLADNGYPTAKSQLYKLTSTGKIPHRKYGSRLVFSHSELLRWAEAQTKDPAAGRGESIAAVARVARRHTTTQ